MKMRTNFEESENKKISHSNSRLNISFIERREDREKKSNRL